MRILADVLWGKKYERGAGQSLGAQTELSELWILSPHHLPSPDTVQLNFWLRIPSGECSVSIFHH
jgi:hypothetical protein